MRPYKTNYIICILFLAGILFFEVLYYMKNNSAIAVFDIKSTTREEISDELVIALFINDIRNITDSFYNNYFTSELEIYIYETKIIDIKKVTAPPYIYITFGITPMIGAHNPVGYDEAVYKVNPSGETELEQFRHLKSYDIPERYHNYIKKPLPETD